MIKVLSFLVIGLYLIVVVFFGLEFLKDFGEWKGSEFKVLFTEDIFQPGKPHFFFFIGEFIGGIIIILQMVAAIKAVNREASSATHELIKTSVIFFVV